MLEIGKPQWQSYKKERDYGSFVQRPAGWTYEWYGNNVDTYCGIQINKVAAQDTGEWTFVTVPVSDGHFKVIVTGMEFSTSIFVKP